MPIDLDHLLKLPFFSGDHNAAVLGLNTWLEAQDEAHDENSASLLPHCRGLVRKLGQAGFLNSCVSLTGGGKPLDVRTLCLSRQVLAYRSALLDFCFAMQGLGSGPISLFGSDEQKHRYLPAVAAGTSLAAFALSESRSGSDVANLETSARREGAAYLLTGEKSWISNAGIADFYIVFARTGEAPGARGISAFIVESDRPGFSVAEQVDTISPHPLGTIRFDECRVPEANRIGPSGGGFKIAMGTLDVFRSTVGAAALGFAHRAIDEAARWSNGRAIFGQMLADFQLTKAAIGEMSISTEAAELLVYRAAWLKDSGQPRVTREAAMAKMQATEVAQRTIDAAVQLFGARGVVKGSVVERLYRDIRAMRIYEGATAIQQLVVGADTLKKPGSEWKPDLPGKTS